MTLDCPVVFATTRTQTIFRVVSHVSFLQEFQDLWPQLSLVIDGGPVGDVQSPECRLGSTVVDLSVSGKYTIIRPGW